MQYWDEVLFPDVLPTIRGQRYLTMTDAQITAELNALTKRAISSFKFPKISLSYSREISGTDSRYFFDNDEVGESEIQILVAWIKVFWVEMIISNSDNFTNLYYDSNIQTYSPGNTLHNYEKMKTSFKTDARQLESNYYRVDSDGAAAIGGVFDDE